MKFYNELKIEVINLDSSDVIATSADVTTEEIPFDWTSTPESRSGTLDESSYNT